MKLHTTDQSFFARTYSIIALLLMLYVTIKACLVGFTHDESITYLIVMGNKGWAQTANNHWLNTILTFLSSKLFGSAEWALRLPNMLAFPFYLYVLYQISRRITQNALPLALALPIFLFNPFVMQYFGMSRGYGLAMTLALGNLYFLLKSLENFDVRNYIYAAICGILTIYANYAFLIWIFALNASYLGCLFVNQKSFETSKKHLIIGLLQAIVLLPALRNLYYLGKGGHLFFGGENNIINDTLLSVISETFIWQVFSYQNILFLGIFIFLFSSSLIVYYKEKNVRFLNITTILVVFIPTFLHHTLNVKLPLERTAMYWVIVFGMYILLVTNCLQNKYQQTKQLQPLILIATIGFMISIGTLGFGQSMQFKYYPTNKRDADLPEMLRLVESQVDITQSHRLGIDWTFEPTINYYRLTQNLDWLEPVTRAGLQGDYDFFYIKNSSQNKLDTSTTEVLHRFEGTRTLLLKRKE